MVRWLRVKWLQYEIFTAATVCVWWEKLCINIFVLLAISLLLRAAMQQGAHLQRLLQHLISPWYALERHCQQAHGCCIGSSMLPYSSRRCSKRRFIALKSSFAWSRYPRAICQLSGFCHGMVSSVQGKAVLPNCLGDIQCSLLLWERIDPAT